ncbi:sterile alpha motif domain-containing protein 3-like [Melanotaenia boesemani]|uniref:sterile alpha motif domain-containing protein 3-like n=1 Tax=Melanotaenia boesemani TaxID=1250792 RepID=UPI001C05168C|nr:sterile alpha motif domain-containing protein 3-like [Melanotaenia boesemani]
MAATLRVILGVDNSSKLILPSGIPGSVDRLKEEIQRQFGLTEDFRLQYRDAEFDNEYMNLTTTGDIKDKSTIKVIYTQNPAPSTVPTTASTAASTGTSSLIDSPSLPDTDILSSPDSSASCSSLRLRKWPLNFPIPEFSFGVQFQLERAQQEYVNNGTLLDPSPKLKSDILDMLASEIAKYKVYPSSADIDDVAEALIQKYPFLKETGSVTGCEGWKVSIRYKMANYRTTLRNIGCPEVAINTLQHKREREESPCRNKVKKARKAEVNFLPQYPAGETKESLEEERQALLMEVKKTNNDQIIKTKMDKTFAHRRREVIEEMPFIAEFKSRWPALFKVHEINAEFTRITTVPLLSTFMSSLDHYSDQLMKILRKKGGEPARWIAAVMSPIGQFWLQFWTWC